MKAQYEDQGAGKGAIVFSEAMFPEGPWAIAIQRSSDQKFLTGKVANPWVGEMFFMERDGEGRGDGALAILIGPEIVDQLDQQDQYRASLRGVDKPARLSIAGITYSANDKLGPWPQTPEPAPAPAPSPAPQAPQEPQPQNPAPEKSLDKPLTMEPAREQQADKRRFWLRAGFVALLVAGCVAWFLFDPRKKDDFPDAPPPVERPAPQASAPKAESIEDQVRDFFKSGNPDPKKAAALAQKLPPKTAREQDAIYRLWYYAAENGEASALLPYAKSMDPSEARHGSIEKDAVEAWKNYEKLRQTDPAAAEAAMSKLRSWLETEAKKGNSRAADWLLLIDQPR